MPEIIGREDERAILQETLDSDRAEFVAVYGRRRVGKTFLIHAFYEKQICFELVGVHNASHAEQLENFAFALELATGGRPQLPVPTTWQEAFQQLIRWLKQSKSKRKRVIFLDELPWLASRRSRFLSAFEHFWNSWASRQDNIVVAVCGSAASWMIKKLVYSRGGLHNRITRRIRLEPFTLRETRTFLKRNRVNLGDLQTIELYMAMGGIPHYLKEVKAGRSAAQNIDSICFTKTGLLRDEFDKLFVSLFEHSDRHVNIVRALAKKRRGMTRDEIRKAAKMPSGGGLTALLDELAESGFIAKSVPFGKSRKDVLYRLIDEYSLFYLTWIEGHKSAARGAWLKLQASPAWKAWSGYTFEGLCLKHVEPMKRALGIEAVHTTEASWLTRGKSQSQRGAQIDLLIDRRDDCINVCEMKFSNTEFKIDRRYAADLRNKLLAFRTATQTRKSLFLTIVTTFGVAPNSYSDELVGNVLTMDALFQ